MRTDYYNSALLSLHQAVEGVANMEGVNANACGTTIAAYADGQGSVSSGAPEHKVPTIALCIVSVLALLLLLIPS